MGELVDWPVCEGRGGWSPVSGEARRKPTFGDPGSWRKCVYCKGERRVTLPTWLRPRDDA